MRKGKIKINEDRCKGCLLCIEQCKMKEIKKSEKINRYGQIIVEFLGSGKCNACTLCAIVCPDAAIEVYELVEEKVDGK